MSNVIRIGGAFLLSVVIIVGALYLREKGVGQTASIVSIEDQSARAYIEGVDNNNNGISDWEEELREMTLRSAEDAPLLEIGSTTSAEPTTLTDRFARRFFESYVRSDVTGTLNEDTQEAFLDSSIGSLTAEANERLYTRDDIKIGDDSDAYLRQYGNLLGALITKNSIDNENEITILERALARENDEDIMKLTNIAKAYDGMLTDTLYTAAPAALVKEHIALTNAFLVMRNDIDAMSQAYTDPLYSLIRVKRYQDDQLALYNSLAAIYSYLYEKGIRYTDDEPAAIFKFEER